MSTAPEDRLGIALGGGGARAAYQMGVLRFIARRWPGLPIPILTGVSAGAINAAHLAGSRASFAGAVDEQCALWLSLRTSKAFRSDATSLLRSVVSWGSRLLLGGSRALPRPQGMLDTTPLREFLAKALDVKHGELPGIAQNIAEGRLLALAVTTTHYASGRTITWVEGHPVAVWKRPQREAILTRIGLDHVMASSALPVLFPATEISGQ